MPRCELFEVLKRINPDFSCDKNCGDDVICMADVQKYVEKSELPQPKEVGASASYNAKTIPQSKIVTN